MLHKKGENPCYDNNCGISIMAAIVKYMIMCFVTDISNGSNQIVNKHVSNRSAVVQNTL